MIFYRAVCVGEWIKVACDLALLCLEGAGVGEWGRWSLGGPRVDRGRSVGSCELMEMTSGVTVFRF